MIRRLGAVLAALTLVAAASPPSGWVVEAVFSGDNVAVSGEWALVANVDPISGATVTALHYDGSAWVPRQALEGSDVDPDDLTFGSDLALAGDIAAVRASAEVYVFEFDGTTWLERAKLAASNVGDTGFGTDIDVDGSTLVVGSLSEAAYVFVKDRSGWVEQARLTASDGEAGDGFGRDVAVSGNTVVAGAAGRDNPGVGPGAAYVFDRLRGRWFETAILTPSEIHWLYFSFGESVDIDGDTVAVSGGFWENGAAWAFERSRAGWGETEIFRSVNGDGTFFFGQQIAIDDNRIGVAATGGFLSSSNGEILVFRDESTEWVLEDRVETGNPLVEEEFGSPFALSGDVIAGVVEYPEYEVYFFRR